MKNLGYPFIAAVLAGLVLTWISISFDSFSEVKINSFYCTIEEKEKLNIVTKRLISTRAHITDPARIKTNLPISTGIDNPEEISMILISLGPNSRKQAQKLAQIIKESLPSETVGVVYRNGDNSKVYEIRFQGEF